MRKLTFSSYTKLRHSLYPQVETHSWEHWVQLLVAHEHRGDPADSLDLDALEARKDGPGLVFGPMVEGMAGRTNANALAIHALALDFDEGGEPALLEALAPLTEFEYVLYSSHKHGAEALPPEKRVRVRVVFPLAEAVMPDDYPAVWRRFDLMTGGVTDRKTKNIARFFYLPSTYDPEKALAFRNQGRWLSVRDLPELPETEVAGKDKTIDGRAAVRKLRHTLTYMPVSDELKPVARAILAGEPYARRGERHNTNLSLTLYVADKTREAPLSNETWAEVLGPSLAAMGNDAPSIEDIIVAYHGAVEKFRARAEREAQELQLQNADGAPYTEEDLARIAEAQGWGVEELDKRWVIQKTSSYWLLSGEGGYLGPYTKDEVPTALFDYLARAPVALTEPTRTGARIRTIQEVMRDHGTVATKVVANLATQGSVFDPRTLTMFEATTPVRDIEPVFDPAIDEWLRIFAGSPETYERLQDWLACAPYLDRLLCALYLSGEPGSGKTILAEGLANIWSGTCTDVDKALSDFNEELTRCPIVLGDESIPTHWKGSPITTKLRSEISRTVRPLSRKYLSTAELHGCIRLVLTANRDDLLGTKGSVTPDDLRAIAQRFLYIYSPKASTDFLLELDHRTRDLWRREGIAAHALWLARNREVIPAGRFWVEGSLSEMTDLMMTSSDWNSRVCEFLVSYLMNPTPIDARGKGLVRRQDGELLVNPQGIIEGWKQVFRDTHIEPETRRISDALRALEKGRVRKRWEGANHRYFVIETHYLMAWSERNNIGDVDLMAVHLQDETARTPGGKVIPLKGGDE